MSKVAVKTYLIEENGYSWLVLERPDGSLAGVDIFNGGGYVHNSKQNDRRDS